MVFFTSDNHIGRKDDGAEAVARWNETVGENDTVYIAGDLFSHNVRDPLGYLEKLSGIKILILGNNDPFWILKSGKAEASRYFASIRNDTVLTVGRHTVGISHYPKKNVTTDVLICGHIHKARKVSGYRDLMSTLSLNAGEMICGGAPVTFPELVRYNEEFYGRAFSDEDKALFGEISGLLK